MCLLQPEHGGEGDLEGGGDGRPLWEDPEAARPRPGVPQLQEGARIQGGWQKDKVGPAKQLQEKY